MGDRSDTLPPWSAGAGEAVEPGEILVREGETDDSVYEVVDGAFEILRGTELSRIDVVGPGATLGEIAAIAQCPRTATVRALRRSVVRRIDRRAYDQWLAADDQRLARLTDLARARIDRQRTIALITELLDVDRTIAAEVVGLSDWVRLEAGDVVFTEGDDSDAGYLVVSGRLTVSRAGSHVGEVARGEIVGEIGLIERAPRSATVEALRESTLARFSVDAFRALVEAHPTLMLKLSRTILARLGRPSTVTDRARSIAVAVTAPLDQRLCTTRITDELSRHGTTCHLWTARIDGALGRPGLVESGLSAAVPALSEYVHEAETTHDYLLLETDDHDTRWTRRALALADRIVVMMSARPDDDELRKVAAVLGGGGARGFAHLGVWRALTELGIDVDTIGGASIGAALGAGMALQIAPDELLPLVAELFHDLLDYTVPVVALIKGERIERNLAKMLAGIELRDLWLPFFCVSTNLTRSQVEVHDRLDAATAIRASVAIPGVLPPVPFKGDLLVDGGVLNNLPCDVMRAAGTVGRMIAVDLSPPVGPSAADDYGLSVSGWKALRSRLGSGPSRFPGLVAILMRSMVAGSVRDRDRMLVESTVDCYLDLDLRGVQLLDFERVAEVADRGYEAARPRLEAWARSVP